MTATATTESTRESCTCGKCVACCHRKPGWFKPGEAERVAEFLGISMQELYDSYLQADYWVDTDDEGIHPTWVLTPAIVGQTPGSVVPIVGVGTCVFLTEDNRCRIHAIKPYECAEAWCGDNGKPAGTVPDPHKDVADAWRSPEAQAQIAALAGDRLALPEPTIGDMIEMTLMSLDRLSGGTRGWR